MNWRWLTGWKYRKEIRIKGTQGTWKNYQTLLKIYEGRNPPPGTIALEWQSARFPSGTNDGGDLRFTAQDGTTELNFWVESVSFPGVEGGRLALIWVKISDDLNKDTTIYCYFGNEEASNASDGSATFIYFGIHGNRKQLTSNTPVNPTYQDGYAYLDVHPGEEVSISPVINPKMNVAVDVLFNFDYGYSDDASLTIATRYSEPLQYYAATVYGSYISNNHWVENSHASPDISNQSTTLVSASSPTFLTTPQKISFKVYQSVLSVYIDDQLKLLTSNNQITSMGSVIISALALKGRIDYIIVRKAAKTDPTVLSVEDTETYPKKHWLTSWRYRRSFTVTRAPYVYFFTVGENPGLKCDFTIKSAAFPNGPNDSGDLRFTLNDGVTPLPFWVSSVEGTAPYRVANVWVRCPETEGYIYYGNENASNVSDPSNTFDIYSDFSSPIDENGQAEFCRTAEDLENELVLSSEGMNLTTNSYSKGGLIFFNPPLQYSSSDGFLIDTRFRFTGSRKADGIAVFFLSDFISFSQRTYGGELAIYETGARGYVLEADIFTNTGESPTPHIILRRIEDGAAGYTLAKVDTSFADGAWHSLRIRRVNQVLDIFLDGKVITSLDFNISKTGVFGISASTGGGTSTQTVDLFLVRPYEKPEPGIVFRGFEENIDLPIALYHPGISIKGLTRQKLTYSYKTKKMRTFDGEELFLDNPGTPTLNFSVQLVGTEEASFELEKWSTLGVRTRAAIPFFPWSTFTTKDSYKDRFEITVHDVTGFEVGGCVIIVYGDSYRSYIIEYIDQNTLNLRTPLVDDYPMGSTCIPAFSGYITSISNKEQVGHNVFTTELQAKEALDVQIGRQGTISEFFYRPKTVKMRSHIYDIRSYRFKETGRMDFDAPKNARGLIIVEHKYTFDKEDVYWKHLRDAFFYSKIKHQPIQVPTWRGEFYIRFESRPPEFGFLRIAPADFFYSFWEQGYRKILLDYHVTTKLFTVFNCIYNGNHCLVVVSPNWDRKPIYGLPVHLVIDAFFADDTLTFDFTKKTCQATVKWIEKF